MEYYYILIRLAKIRKADKYLLLATIWSNQNSQTMLVEILTTLEEYSDIFIKWNIYLWHQSGTLLWYFPQEKSESVCPSEDFCIYSFTLALCKTIKRKKN